MKALPRFTALLLLCAWEMTAHAQRFTPQGQVVFTTKVGSAVDAPVFLPDGRGAGNQPGMVAQLFLVTVDGLIPLDIPTTFRTSGTVPLALAYIIGQTVGFAEPQPGMTGTFRFRAWESTKGASFEESRDSGGYYGESEVTIVVGGGMNPPSNLVGLQGFVLARRETLALDGVNESQITLHLESTSPRTYTLESSTDLIHWSSFGSIQVTGDSQVTLPVAGGLRFFRAVLQL